MNKGKKKVKIKKIISSSSSSKTKSKDKISFKEENQSEGNENALNIIENENDNPIEENIKITKINITEKELDKIKIICDLIFLDEYSEFATFSNFEESLGTLILNTNIDLLEIFKLIAGRKKTYITFGRILVAYQKAKDNLNMNLKNFFNYIFSIIRNEGNANDMIGTNDINGVFFSSRKSHLHKAISKISILTNETKEDIKGFIIEYDEILKNNLYIKTEEKNFISLEINLNIDNNIPLTEKELINDPSSRDGINIIFGTYTDHITFLGFKCRSGKIRFIGKPEGKSFIFGQYGKQLKIMTLSINSYNHLIIQLLPSFKEIKKNNPFINKNLNELNNEISNVDLPIYEEEKLSSIENEDEIEKIIINSVINEKSFFEKQYDDKIKGVSFSDIYPYKRRIFEPKKATLLKKINDNQLRKEAIDFNKKQNERVFNLNLIKRIKENELKYSTIDEDSINDNSIINSSREHTTSDIILNPINYDIMLNHVEENIKNKYYNDTPITVFKSSKRVNNRFLTEFEKSEKEKIKKAQKLWKELCELYCKNQGIFILQTIGAVIKGRKFLNDEKEGKDNLYNPTEKMELIKILKENRNIVIMLSKAHRESKRREKEIERIKKETEELEKKEKESIKFLENIKEKTINERNKKIENINKELEKINKDIKRIKDKNILNNLQIALVKQKTLKEQLIKENEEIQKIDNLKLLSDKISINALEKEQKKIISQSKIEENKNLISASLIDKGLSLQEEKNRLIEDEKQRKKKRDLELNIEETYRELPKKVKTSDLPIINKKMNNLKKMMDNPDYENDYLLLKNYYDDLEKDRNAILNHYEEKEKKKVLSNMDINSEEIKKNQIKERNKIKEEQDSKIKKEIEKEKITTSQKLKSKSIISIQGRKLNEGIKIFKNQEKYNKNSIFIDDYFLPIMDNLCPMKNGEFILHEGLYESDIEGWELYKWKRAENIFNSKDYQVFYEGITFDDVIQGGLGNCYFLSAICALTKYSNAIEDLFYIKEKSKEHCYGIYLRINGRWKLILLDDYIPCDSKNNFVFSSTNGNELWVILLEKAIAKVFGNYARTCGGFPEEIFQLTTNAPTVVYMINNTNQKRILYEFKQAMNNDYIMSAGTNSDNPNQKIFLEEVGLIPEHAYSILSVNEVIQDNGKKIILLHIRNPFGETEWSCEFSDKSPLWTENLKKQVKFEDKEDGAFFMPFDKFMFYFNFVSICYLHNDYESSFTHIKKEKAIKGPVMFSFRINSKIRIFIEQWQKNIRIPLKDGSYPKKVPGYLLVVSEYGKFIEGNNNIFNNCCLDMLLDKGKYYLISDINYRYFDENKHHGYNITCYSSVKIDLVEENSNNILRIMKSALLDYSEHGVSKKVFSNGLKVYNPTVENEIGFIFIVIDNRLNDNDITTKSTFNNSSNDRQACWYLEKKENINKNSITKIIPSGEYDIIMSMDYNKKGDNEFETSIESKTSNKIRRVETNILKNISKKLFDSEGEAIDRKGKLKQYVISSNDYYYVGLENSSNVKYKFKLDLEGVHQLNNKGNKSISFTSNPQSKSTFVLKSDGNDVEEKSFRFLYDN